ncbi:Ornithine cyclodeaminase [Pseudonocardia sp. Ae168_Ps1]|uniref:ornithine cyclodeaminase family protein n=1 Tax=unclassified Pseudonocardia TaxID=2619320 RepID=UPI00094AF863|nr:MULTISPECIES: ornithine cyclodeaminase family protein [unclassified Pseudonocardia]OLL76870.1 Ornithine cyclodeaminase [Pseudonocardia sp. Ae150A_Ps1]OLL82884.1 Ornithine cyclodeaminase [Pseudonocardia sp. Ae168_Ps1]OLL83004.1 Ornithine cyclodeaminase [Pseudonocardia sp. Ae263_Ps1]OLL90958.1 Ornithine cyclodeaminase [Pseudonocardia sp. Ae356_Ps1]
MKLWTEDDVRSGPTLPQVIDSLEAVLSHEAAGSAWNLDKTMTTWPHGDARGSAHALGALDRDADLAIFKTWVNTPTGASALMTVFSAGDGATLGVAEAGAAGALRAAAISGVATRVMADPDADELAVLGAGRQALRQVEAVAAVRPLRRVRLWNRTTERAHALADQVRGELGLDAVVAGSVGEATRDVPVVTLVTRAPEPFLRLEHLARGAHLNAVGAILPSHAEFDPALLGESALTVVDSETNARRGSRELREYFGPAETDGWGALRRLCDVVAGKAERPSRPRCTVFKGMGMGLSDLAVARLLVGGRS